MKLKDGFCTQKIGNGQVMVPTDEAKTKFRGIVRSNETAAFVVNCLKKETTREEILSKLQGKYDGDLDLMSKDLDEVLKKLKRIHAIRE